MKYPSDFEQNLRHYDPKDPDPWLALYLDRSTPIADEAKAALLRGHRSFSRRCILPLVRPLSRLMIVIVQLIRLVLPRRIQSSAVLHRLIYWGLKYFVTPDANMLILRHFTIGTEILNFIADNVPDVHIKKHPLRPEKLEDLIDNSFLQHDLNIYNFIIQLNSQLRQQQRDITPPQVINFSSISNEPFEFKKFPDKWHNFIDIQSAIELYTPLYGLFLSDHDFWRASNSLQLDETIAIYVAKILGNNHHLALVSNKHPLVPFSTLEAGFRLMLHGQDAENLHGFLRQMKNVATAPQSSALHQ